MEQSSTFRQSPQSWQPEKVYSESASICVSNPLSLTASMVFSSANIVVLFFFLGLPHIPSTFIVSSVHFDKRLFYRKPGFFSIRFFLPAFLHVPFLYLWIAHQTLLFTWWPEEGNIFSLDIWNHFT
jgi:hypothetical protein